MLEIREVLTPADRKRFVMLPWAVNRGDAHFVPPVIADDLKLCDPARHPFYAGNRAEGRFFLALRDGVPVGRIGAIRNPTHEQHWKESAGFFGFYECVDRAEAGAETTRELVARARACARAWGLGHFYGPASPSSNYLYGTLIEGFDTPPRLLMPYNPPHYDGLLLRAGLTKAKDLLAWELTTQADFARVKRIAERVEHRQGITIRSIDLKRFPQELELVKALMHDIWSANWGSVPMSDPEYALMASELRPLVDPGLALFAEVKGEPVGFVLALPDAFEALKSRWVNGRPLTPWGLAALLGHIFIWPKIRGIRILLLGLRKDFRTIALGTLFYVRIFDHAVRKGYVRGEASWVLEDNAPMNAALRAMNARITKKYRIYRGEAGSA